MSAVGSALSWLKNVIIYRGVPVLVAFGIYSIGTPWYAAVLVLLTVQYWYGPVLVYLRQRMPTLQALRVAGADAVLPPEHAPSFDKTMPMLQAAGFVQNGRFTSADPRQPIRGTVTLMQHQGTSDLAHLLVVTNNDRIAEMLAFSRSRTDGSRISTVWSTVHSPFPPNPRDNVLRINGDIAPLDLWRVHQARVAADPDAKPNDMVTDALSYQMNLEREGVRRNIASGMWQQDEQPGFLRPTAMGAFLMCLRMLFPWKQLSRIRARMEVRRLLRGSSKTSIQ